MLLLRPNGKGGGQQPIPNNARTNFWLIDRIALRQNDCNYLFFYNTSLSVFFTILLKCRVKF